jgi:hypothetical protein
LPDQLDVLRCVRQPVRAESDAGDLGIAERDFLSKVFIPVSEARRAELDAWPGRDIVR